MSRERRKPKSVKMDMTPMIDVVFQLIIFFILTMTVTSPDLRPVQLPTALTAVPENTREQITMLHMYNDYQPPIDPFDVNAGKGDKLSGWHVTLSRDPRRFILPQAGGVKKGPTDMVLKEGLPEVLKTRAEQWKPDKEDLIQEVTTTIDSGKVYNMPILIRGDMRAPVIYFAAIVEACELARIWRIQVSIAPPPESLSRPGGGQ